MKARSRFIKESFLNDKIIGKMPVHVRFTYIGLWMVCDDGGWTRNDPEEIGITLFPWDEAHERESRVEDAIEQLARAGRVVLHPCGHMQIPTLGRYQHPGRPTYTYRDEHRDCMVSSGYSLSAVREGKGVGGEGSFLQENDNGTPSSPRASAREGDVTFKDAMERHGWRR